MPAGLIAVVEVQKRQRSLKCEFIEWMRAGIGRGLSGDDRGNALLCFIGFHVERDGINLGIARRLAFTVHR
jgi:hypothetical protein